MSVSVTFNGVVYTIPSNRQPAGWGTTLTTYLESLGNNALAKSGGAFTLTADANFGANFGLITKYYKSTGTNIAATGVIRLASLEILAWRNNANDGDLPLTVDSSDRLTFDGKLITALALGAAHTVLTMNAGGTATEYAKIDNANIAASGTADIAHNKLVALALNETLETDTNGYIVASGIDKDRIRNGISTALISGGSLSVDADNTKFDLAAGTGVVVDNYTNPNVPTYAEVSWNAFDAQTTTNIGSSPQTFVFINSSSAIVQQTTFPTASNLRDYIFVGVLIHPNLTTISSVNDVALNVGTDVQLSLLDLSNAVGPINESGNVYSDNGANLNIDKSAGVAHVTGINYKADMQNPNRITLVSTTAGSFLYSRKDGSGGYTLSASSALIDPANYDDGDGTLGTVTTNKWTIQRIFLGATVVVIEYGQFLYNSKAQALAAINTELHDSNPALDGTLLRCFLITRGGATLLNDLTHGTFIPAGKFGGQGSNGGTSSTTNLQQAYDNSPTPQTILTAASGGMMIEDAATPIAADLWSVQDSGGSNKFLTVDEDGAYVGNSRDTSAAFDITSTTKGLGLPNMTTTQRDAISSPKTGLEIWNTTTGAANVYNSAAWVAFSVSTLATATPDTEGKVTSFAGIVKSGIKAAVADYIVSDTDGFDAIEMTTSTTDRVVTLGTAADNKNRILRISIVDDATGKLTIDGEGSETINGATTIVLFDQFDSVTLRCTGTAWVIISDNRVPATIHYTGSSLAYVSLTQAPYGTLVTSKGGMSISSGVVTVPRAGTYLIMGSAQLTATTAGNSMDVYIGGVRKNIGMEIGANDVGNIFGYVSLAAGATVGIALSATRTGTTNVESNYISVTEVRTNP